MTESNWQTEGRQTYEHSYVRSLFNRIAPRYDFLNHFLSFGLDILWRKKAIRLIAEYEPKTILDIATGTADLALEASSLQPARIYGIDLSPAMLEFARRKIRRRGLSDIISVKEGAAEDLPFEDGTFDVVMVSFGVRNFSDLERGLREMYRVLRPGGAVMILEFSRPRLQPFRQIYSLYFTKLLPCLGGLISSSREAYQYLPSTVESFPDGELMMQILRTHRFIGPFQTPLSLGIATIYIAEKPTRD